VLNYPNAEYSILEKSFRAIRLLMEHNVIVPTDAIHILRVYQIQAIVVTTFYYNHNNTHHHTKLLFNVRGKQRTSKTSHSLDDHHYYDDDDDEEEDDDNGGDGDDDDDEIQQVTALPPPTTHDAVSVINTITREVNDDDNDENENDEVVQDNTSDTVAVATQSSATTSTSISSWFGWGATSTTNTIPQSASSKDAASVESPSQPTSVAVPLRNSFTIKRNAVSSSHGGSGTNLSAKHMENLALELLSSLVQLMELLRNRHPTMLRQSNDIWTNATALACLFGFQWYTPFQQQQLLLSVPTSSSGGSSGSTAASMTSRQSTVQQAAHATVSQFISSLFSTQSETNSKFVQATWDDLLVLTSSATTKATISLQGTFKQCKRKVSAYHADQSSVSQSTAPTPATVATPPSPEFALELMTQIWKDMTKHLDGSHQDDDNNGNNRFTPSDAMIVKSMGVTMSLIQKLSKTSVEKSLRVVQWTLIFVQSTSTAYPNECRELLLQLMKQITIVTDQCRSSHDFEDGYVFSTVPDDINDTKRKSITLDSVTTVFPMGQLWKAGFVLEAIYYILDRRGNRKDEDLPIIIFGMDDGRKVLQTLVEALSDFATIGTSCRDHIHQVVEFCCNQNPSSIKPTIFRRAEQGIAMGTNFTL
jgi:hypothetical protein